MNVLKQLNSAISYIEENLCAEFSLDIAAKIACVSTDSFIRFFSYMTGMTINEYIRRRKLTQAAYELKYNKAAIIDIAIKYGYNSQTSFSRAFFNQHGISPTAYRKYGGSLKVYPPVSFHIMIKGAKEMNFKVIKLNETKVYGITRQFEGQGYKTHEELRHIMWADTCENIPSLLCEGNWNQAGNTSYDGVWYGIWKDGKYMIAREETDIKNGNFDSCVIPAGTYATFKTEPGALAWEEFPRLFELIFESWLPTSGYTLNGDIIIEILHLWTDRDLRQKNRYYEVWIPIKEL